MALAGNIVLPSSRFVTHINTITGFIWIPMLKRFLFALSAAFLILIAIVITNTLSHTAIPPSQSYSPFELALNKAEISEKLAAAIRIRTIAERDKVQSNATAFLKLHHHLENSFPRVHQHLERTKINEFSLLYKWQGTDPQLKPIMLTAHQDVVPANPSSLDQWEQPPFSGNIDEHFIWGRGALDNKSGVVGILEAVEHLLKLGFIPKRTVYLGFGHDEEVGGEQGAKQIAEYLKVNNISLEFLLDEGGAVIKDHVIPGIVSPIALVGIAEKGYLTLEVTTTGASGHSSMPPKQTAAGKLSETIVAIEANPMPANIEYMEMMFSNMLHKLPFIQRMAFSNSWLFQPMLEKVLGEKSATNAAIRTTTAVTMLDAGVSENVLPTTATATINFRTLPTDNSEDIISHLKQVTGLSDDHFVVKADKNATRISATDSFAFNTIHNTIHEVIDNKELIVAPYLMVGGTDSKHFEEVSENQYRFLIASLDREDQKRIHGINERISIEDYSLMVKFYFRFLQNSAF